MVTYAFNLSTQRGRQICEFKVSLVDNSKFQTSQGLHKAS